MTDPLDLVDPELRPLLELWPTIDLTAELLPAMRAGGRLPAPPVADNDVRVETRQVPGPAGAPDVGLHIYHPAGVGPFGCIYHIHGGGYVAGDAASLEFAHRPLAAALGCVIVSVDYRLAPETPHPGPIEDCYAGLAWVVAHADALGIDEGRLGVMGESAGGGLAAALALLARDRGEHALAFQHLIYPMLDDRTCTREAHPTAGEFIWNRAKNIFGWASLLGHEPGRDAGVSPYAAPARSESLAGLPPTFISTGALDLFVDEDIDYAKRLIAAGVPTEFHIYPGAYHAFNLVAGARTAQAATRDSREALRRALHG